MITAPGLDFLMQLRVEFESPLTLADVPLGTRLILHASGGSFDGPAAKGDVLPGGGDWLLRRPDGVAELDIRFVLRTCDDQLIYVRGLGIVEMTAEVAARIRDGATVAAHEYYFRTCLLFETGATPYRDLNRRLSIGIGRRTPTGMVTDAFMLR